MPHKPKDVSQDSDADRQWQGRLESAARYGIATLFVIGCALVLYPFLSAILFAGVIALSTWPAYRWLLGRLRGHQAPSALLACVLVTALILTPAALMANSIGDAAAWLFKSYDDWIHGGAATAPAWLIRVPLVGAWLGAHWDQLLTGPSAGASLARELVDPVRRYALNSGMALGNGLLQIMITLIVLFFFYANGQRVGRDIQTLAQRLWGGTARELLEIARLTVCSVMIAIAGTATAQALVALIGFSVAGVPGPMLLAAATFLLSMVPVGPPLIWGGAALWLFQQGEAGWALFMALYGLLCISTVDNIIKPILISRGAHLPFVVTLLGVLGGLYAFGLIGLFLGPTILALAINLNARWLMPGRVEGNRST